MHTRTSTTTLCYVASCLAILTENVIAQTCNCLNCAVLLYTFDIQEMPTLARLNQQRMDGGSLKKSSSNLRPLHACRSTDSPTPSTVPAPVQVDKQHRSGSQLRTVAATSSLLDMTADVTASSWALSYAVLTKSREKVAQAGKSNVENGKEMHMALARSYIDWAKQQRTMNAAISPPRFQGGVLSPTTVQKSADSNLAECTPVSRVLNRRPRPQHCQATRLCDGDAAPAGIPPKLHLCYSWVNLYPIVLQTFSSINLASNRCQIFYILPVFKVIMMDGKMDGDHLGQAIQQGVFR